MWIDSPLWLYFLDGQQHWASFHALTGLPSPAMYSWEEKWQQWFLDSIPEQSKMGLVSEVRQRDQHRCELTSCTASEVFNLDQLLYVPMPQFPYLQKRHCAFYFTGLLWVPREKEEERRPSAHWLLEEASDELHFFTPTISITSASTMMGHWCGYLGHSDGHSRQKNFCPPGASGHSSIPKGVNEASYYYNSTFLLLIAK